MAMGAIKDATQALLRGAMAIVADGEGRENEGDRILARPSAFAINKKGDQP